MKDLNHIIHIVSSFCIKEPAILAAYLFGSVVKGESINADDLDIAILLDEAYSERFSILSFISAIEKKLGCRADIVNLNKAGDILKFEVRRSGKLVFERDTDLRKKYEIRGRKSYEDFLYLHKRYVNSVLYGGKHG